MPHDHGHIHGHADHHHGFAARAATYDDTAGTVSQPFYRLLAETVTLPDGATLLDVGCGTGTLLKLLVAGRNIHAHGIDAEENMVQAAKEKCPEADIRVAPCDAAPYPDATFDVLTVCLAYHHFPNQAAFAQEALRLLKPGGKLYIAEPCAPLPGHNPAHHADHSADHSAGHPLAHNSGHTPQATAPHRHHGGAAAPIPAEELFAFFAGNGFSPAGSAAQGYAQVVILEKPA